MTQDQVNEAIEQMKFHCDLKMANYDLISARGTLYELGYFGDKAEQVLQYCFDRGFNYCLDPDYHVSRETPPLRIPESVCYWGPDQLKSRLECVR